jgi:RimJ/RimL family protein N-acetyltransferase
MVKQGDAKNYMSNIKFYNIETERLILRKFKESDTETFFKYRTNPQVALYQGERWVNFKFEQAIEFVKEQMNSEPGIPDSWFQIAIELKDNRDLIGDCAIHTLPQDINQVEIGVTLNPLYQNKGFGAETVKHLIEYIFNVLNKHRVIAITDVRNKNSIKLLERIGMRKEGHFIKNAWNKGEYTDEYLFALLKEEWL